MLVPVLWGNNETRDYATIHTGVGDRGFKRSLPNSSSEVGLGLHPEPSALESANRGGTPATGQESGREAWVNEPWATRTSPAFSRHPRSSN